MSDAHKNFSYSNVAAAPSPATSGTSLTVTATDGAKFPTPPFNATVWPSGALPLSSNSEIVRVIAIASDVLTITRTQESTSARTIVVGDQIAATVTAKTLTDLEDSITQVFNVKGPSYGAKGDSTTDDTTAIQSAINAANTAGGGIVFFPKGTYKITAALKLYTGTTPTITAFSNITLAGSGPSGTGGSVIAQATTGADVIKGLNDVANGAQSSNVVIRDLCLTFSGTATNSGNGLYLAQQAAGGPSFQQFTIQNVTVIGCQGTGKYGFNVESMIVSTFDTCMAVTCANGFYLNGAAASAYSSVSTSVTFINCYANMAANGLIGYNCNDNTYVSFVGCAADYGANSTGTAYQITGSNCVALVGCGTELNGTVTLTAGYKISSSTNIALYNCYMFQSKSTTDVWVTSTSTQVTVIGFQDNSSVSGSTGLKVDAASVNTEIDCSWGAAATQRNIAGTNVIVHDGAGNTTLKNLFLPFTGILSSNGAGLVSAVTAPTGTIVGTSDTQTLTNKRVTKRTGTTTSTATPSINSDTTDFYSITALAVNITSVTVTGTPTEGQTLWIAITGTAARTIAWGTSFEASTVALPTTTVTTARLDVGFIWNTVTSKWRCVAVA